MCSKAIEDVFLLNIDEDEETAANFEIPLNHSFEDQIDFQLLPGDFFQLEEEVDPVQVEDVGFAVEVGGLGDDGLAEVDLQRNVAFKGREDFFFEKEYQKYIITHAQVYNYLSFEEYLFLIVFFFFFSGGFILYLV